MAEANDALLAVERLCEILKKMVEIPGQCGPQFSMLAYDLQKLKLGCKSLREGYRTGLAEEILRPREG